MKAWLLMSLVAATALSFVAPKHLPVYTQGIYKSLDDFKNQGLRCFGAIITQQPDMIVIKTDVSELKYSSKEIWGYRSEDGNAYRSIDHLFYKMLSEGPVWIYEAEVNGELSYKMGVSVQQYPVDLDEKNLVRIIQQDEKLHESFQALKKKERNEQLIDYLVEFNKKQEALLTFNE